MPTVKTTIGVMARTGVVFITMGVSGSMAEAMAAEGIMSVRDGGFVCGMVSAAVLFGLLPAARFWEAAACDSGSGSQSEDATAAEAAGPQSGVSDSERIAQGDTP